MALHTLPNGNLVPSPETRKEFAREIYHLVGLVVFSGRSKMAVLMEGTEVIVSLPSETEILDFATLKPGNEPTGITIIMRLPVEGAENTYHNIGISYEPLL